MNFSKNTIDKVAAFIANQRMLGTNDGLIKLRADNYRRTLELDMSNRKHPTIPGMRQALAKGLGFPVHASQNARRSARLERRVKVFETQPMHVQLNETRPGSMTK